MIRQPAKKLLTFSILLVAWAFSTKADDAASNVALVWRAHLPDMGSQSSAAIALDETIYQGTFHGWLFAIAPEGKVKWKFSAKNEIKSSPAVADDGTVYFGSRDRNFYALTPGGKLKWTFATGAWVDSSPAVAADGTVYFGSWDKNFYALDPDGKLKWKLATSNLVTSSPAIARDGTIYFGSHDKFFYALAPDGKLKWKFLTGAEVDGSPVIGADGTVYFSSTDGNLYALRADGAELWRFRTGSYAESSPVLDADGNLYLMASRDHLSVSRDGKLRWRHPVDVPLDMAPAVTANGQVFVSQPWHGIISLSTTNGWPPQWDFRMDFNLGSAPNLSAEGIVYACDGANLFALKPTNAAPPAKSAWPVWRGNPQHNGRAQKVN